MANRCSLVSLSLIAAAACQQVGCGAPKPRTKKPQPSPPTATAAAATAEPASSATAATVAPLQPPATPEQWKELIGFEPPLDQLPDPNERKFFAVCYEFVKHFKQVGQELAQKEKVQNQAQATLRIIAAMKQNPPPLPLPTLKFCSEQMVEGVRRLGIAVKVAEAQAVLQRLAKGMVKAHEKTGKLCPAAEPVPAQLEQVLGGAQYPPKPEDWQTPGWQCLQFAPKQPVSFQYALQSNPQKGQFTIRADGAPTGLTLVEYRVDGEVKDGKIVFSKLLGPLLPEILERAQTVRIPLTHVECAAAAATVDCYIQTPPGSPALTACWDIAFECGPDNQVASSVCHQVPGGGGIITKQLPTAKIAKQQSCEQPQRTRVTNLKATALR